MVSDPLNGHVGLMLSIPIDTYKHLSYKRRISFDIQNTYNYSASILMVTTLCPAKWLGSGCSMVIEGRLSLKEENIRGYLSTSMTVTDNDGVNESL